MYFLQLKTITIIMKYFKTYWFYILAAIITVIGLVTGWYLFIFLIIPFGLFNFGGKDRNE